MRASAWYIVSETGEQWTIQEMDCRKRGFTETSETRNTIFRLQLASLLRVLTASGITFTTFRASVLTSRLLIYCAHCLCFRLPVIQRNVTGIFCLFVGIFHSYPKDNHCRDLSTYNSLMVRFLNRETIVTDCLLYDDKSSTTWIF